MQGTAMAPFAEASMITTLLAREWTNQRVMSAFTDWDEHIAKLVGKDKFGSSEGSGGGGGSSNGSGARTGKNYTLNKDGSFTELNNGEENSAENGTDKDVLYTPNGFLSMSISVPAGTIESMTSQLYNGNTSYYFDFGSNESDAQNFFEFCAQNSDVEWGIIKVDGEFTVATSRENAAIFAFVPILSDLKSNNQQNKLYWSIHSHTTNSRSNSSLGLDYPSDCQPSGNILNSRSDYGQRYLMNSQSEGYIDTKTYLYCPYFKQYKIYYINNNGVEESSPGSPF